MLGWIQRSEDLRFALESSHALGVARKGFGQEFQRHLAAELGVRGAENLAHSTLADGGRDPIVRECATDQISPPSHAVTDCDFASRSERSLFYIKNFRDCGAQDRTKRPRGFIQIC